MSAIPVIVFMKMVVYYSPAGLLNDLIINSEMPIKAGTPLCS
jgi:hypothetical protein